jgi:hypothetical protein
LDHILITQNMLPALASVDPIHIDANFPALATVNTTNVQRASDHDPVQIRLRPAGAGMVGGNLHYADTVVQMLDGAQQVVAEARTDALGDFRLWNLTPGLYKLRIVTPAYLLSAQPEMDLAVKTGYNSLRELNVRHRTVDIASATALLAVNMAIAVKQ